MAINVAVYGRKHNRWAMTERGRGALAAGRSDFAVGRSSLRWDGYAMTISIDEIAAPIPLRVRGTVRLYPEALSSQSFALDRAGRHCWQPLATRAAVEVDLQHPSAKWRGGGYIDHNRGSEPLEAGFRNWNWSRAHLSDGAAVLYEGEEMGGGNFSLALRFDRDGRARDIEPPGYSALSSTPIWWMPRSTRSDAGRHPTVLRTFEDAPFYARSALATHLFGEPAIAMHESLSLSRLDSAIVRQMLPYRMPRAIL